jgi:hypothetical protein
MYELQSYPLKHTETIVFRHNECDVATLVRLAADWLESCNGTLISIVYSNDDENDVYTEAIEVTAEIT